MMTKLISWAIATPTTNPGVVSYENMTETRTKLQMRKPTEKSSQVATSSLDSWRAPMISRMLARAYLGGIQTLFLVYSMSLIFS